MSERDACVLCGAYLSNHVDGKCPNPPPHRDVGSADFHAARALIGELHDKKQRDYGQEGDPFANIRQAVQWGLPASLGACIRIGDKVSRLKTFYKTGELANESVEDAFLDLAVYALIGYCLFQEEASAKEAQAPAPSDLPRTRCPRCFGAGDITYPDGRVEVCRWCQRTQIVNATGGNETPGPRCIEVSSSGAVCQRRYGHDGGHTDGLIMWGGGA